MSLMSMEINDTLPETDSSPPTHKERIVFQPSIFRYELLVLGKV